MQIIDFERITSNCGTIDEHSQNRDWPINWKWIFEKNDSFSKWFRTHFSPFQSTQSSMKSNQNKKMIPCPVIIIVSINRKKTSNKKSFSRNTNHLRSKSWNEIQLDNIAKKTEKILLDPSKSEKKMKKKKRKKKGDVDTFSRTARGASRSSFVMQMSAIYLCVCVCVCVWTAAGAISRRL